MPKWQGAVSVKTCPIKRDLSERMQGAKAPGAGSLRALCAQFRYFLLRVVRYP